MLKRIKTFMVAVVLLCAAPLAADDFDWSQCWCNYGAGIKQGDMMLSVDAGFNPWYGFNAFNNGGFATPTIAVDFEVAVPVWKLPFTFGGYLTADYCNYTYDDSRKYDHTRINAGASATYHMQMPPANLDLYTGLKTGVSVDFSDCYANGSFLAFDFGYNIGASWYFSDSFGVNVELGYPMCKGGVVFKFQIEKYTITSGVTGILVCNSIYCS